MSNTIPGLGITPHLEMAFEAAACFRNADSKAMAIFSFHVPKDIQNGVYGELYPLKHFSNNYWECAQHAFHDQCGQTASSEKKAQAIYNYFLRCMIDLFKQNDPRAMDLFSKLPEEVRKGIYCELGDSSAQKVKAIETYLKYTAQSRMMALPRDVLGLIFTQLDDVSLRVLRHVSIELRNKIQLERYSLRPLQHGAMISARLYISGTDLCVALVKRGHLKLLQWAIAGGCPWDKSTCKWAAASGHMDVLQWVRASGCPWDKSTCDWAAASGHMDVLQWAIANGCPWNENQVRAAARNHPAILEWLNSIKASKS